MSERDERGPQSNGRYRVIGTRPVRHDGLEKVDGSARYGADIRLPGMLYGAVLRSPVPHARIQALDTSGARALEGVKAVITGADLPTLSGDEVADLGESAIGMKFMSDLVMAREKVVFKGQPLAAIAATTMQRAREALAQIQVEYDPLPVVDDVLEAMEPSAPLLHDDLITISMAGSQERPSNIARHVEHSRGDVTQGFAETGVIVQREFRTQMVHQGYIEPQNATARVAPDGDITIWTSTQGAFKVRDQVADLLEIAAGSITVVPLEIGGGFGGKIQVYLEPLAVLLARQSGRPVKMWMTRDEVFQATGPGSGTAIRCRMGASRDGRLLAAQLWLAYDAGAYPGSPVGAACVTGLSPYTIPHLQIDGFDVVTNKPRVQAYRAPGATPAAFAVETVLDELAEELALDPLELRLKNAAGDGDRMTNGVPFNRIGFKELLETVAASDHYQAPLGGEHRGRGVAAGFWKNGVGRSAVHLTFLADGSVNLLEGSTDIGGSRASMAMIVAEELGLKAGDVKPYVADTDTVAYTSVTGGSRVTYTTGAACHRAARKAMARLRQAAAQVLDVDEERLLYGVGDDGRGEFRGPQGDRSVSVRTLIGRLDDLVVDGQARGLQMMPSFGVHVADVEVDPETGKVAILRYTAFQDVGKAIHPDYVEGQMQGGAVQGIGWALTEEYVFEQGEMLNPTLLDYRMPTALDLPMIDTVFIEIPAADGPYGVRGVGEVPIVPPPPALANAIYRAVGVRMRQLPMSPERVFMALHDTEEVEVSLQVEE